MSDVKVIDGKAFAKSVRERVSKQVQYLKTYENLTPGLAVVLVGKTLPVRFM